MTRLPGFLATVSFVPPTSLPLLWPRLEHERPGRHGRAQCDQSGRHDQPPSEESHQVTFHFDGRRVSPFRISLHRLVADPRQRARRRQVELADRDVSGLPREPDRGTCVRTRRRAVVRSAGGRGGPPGRRRRSGGRSGWRIGSPVRGSCSRSCHRSRRPHRLARHGSGGPGRNRSAEADRHRRPGHFGA